ncbi:hypothetical protein Poly59_01470 [Rubripirellula reticaptiva]|uniref:Uncharacterized protein n=2 Tax=Rubripirellula reticaptiva TaxID=2528013 RepID=A0A5C6F9K7_9BACT|nr:hypothetical protein Poly59_01470 [Rubripirellula reticaptiva]
MAPDENGYVFQCNENVVIVASQKCKYFIQSSSKPYLHDVNLLVKEPGANGELAKRISDHSAWIAIDIYQWPQNTEQAETVSIPRKASQRLVEYAKELVGDFATVAIHSDNQTFVPCD